MRRRRPKLSEAHVRFAAAELGIAIKSDPPTCPHCRDRGFVVIGDEVDACMHCTRQAERDWIDRHG